MKLKELIQKCSELLGLELSRSYFQATSQPQNTYIDKLVACFDSVYEELFRDYASPLRRTVVQSADGVVDLSGLRLNKVVSLTDGEGRDVPFRYSDNALSVGRQGSFNLCYSRLPDDVAWDEEIKLPAPYLSDRLLTYGIMREYLCTVGDWSAAGMWDERYRTAITAACSKTTSMRLPVGRWW